MLYNGPERRKCKRIERPLIANFKVRKQNSKKWVSAKWNVVTVLNVGVMGALFTHDKKVRLGSTMALEIRFPEITIPVSCAGKVIRVEPVQGENSYTIAVLFTNIRKKEQEVIDYFVENVFSENI